MISLNFDVNDLISATCNTSADTCSASSLPFNLRFKRKSLDDSQMSAISGTGLYLISRGTEVVYLGKYQPMDGNIIADRWGRHLQTITARGINIGFGGRNANERLTSMLDAVDHPDLQDALKAAFNDSAKRFRDTGYSTTPNRLRFASENWDVFSSATPEEIQSSVTFRLLKIRPSLHQTQAKIEVSAIEKRILGQFKPCCNKEYKHAIHREMRANNSVQDIITAIRKATIEITGQDVVSCVTLAGA